MGMAAPIYYCVVPREQARTLDWTRMRDLLLVERERLAWHPRPSAEPLSLALAELFRPV